MSARILVFVCVVLAPSVRGLDADGGGTLPTRILLIRHARSAGDPFATPGRPVRGFLADPLGLKQAQAAAEVLKGERVDVAFSSPYGRALQTAEIVLAGRDVPIHVLPALREWMPSPP